MEQKNLPDFKLFNKKENEKKRVSNESFYKKNKEKNDKSLAFSYLIV